MMDNAISIFSSLLSSGLLWTLIKVLVPFALGMITYHYLLRVNPTLLQSIVDKSNAVSDKAKVYVADVKGGKKTDSTTPKA